VISHAAFATGAYLLGCRAGESAATGDSGVPAAVDEDDSVWREGEFEQLEAEEAAAKADLLDHLLHRAYVKLAPSRVAGVGVVALIDIPAATDPFLPPNPHLCRSERSIRLAVEELQELPPPVLEHVLSFHDSIDGGCIVPVNACGTVAMDASWFLNHANEPAAVNTETYRPEQGEGGGARGFCAYRTTRKVCAGEELLLDYRTVLPSVWERVVATRTQEGTPS